MVSFVCPQQHTYGSERGRVHPFGGIYCAHWVHRHTPPLSRQALDPLDPETGAIVRALGGSLLDRFPMQDHVAVERLRERSLWYVAVCTAGPSALCPSPSLVPQDLRFVIDVLYAVVAQEEVMHPVPPDTDVVYLNVRGTRFLTGGRLWPTIESSNLSLAMNTLSVVVRCGASPGTL